MNNEKISFQEAQKAFVSSLGLFTETLIEAQQKIANAYDVDTPVFAKSTSL